MTKQLPLFGREEQKLRRSQRKQSSPEDRLSLLVELALEKLSATDPMDMTVRDAIELLKLAIAEEKRLSANNGVKVQLKDAIREIYGM